MKSLVGLVALLAASSAYGQLTYGLPANVSNVQYRTMATGTDLTTNTPGVFVFNGTDRMGELLATESSRPGPAMERNFFQRWRLVAIHAGDRPTGGYGLGVQKIVRRIDKATIFGIEAIPSRGSRPQKGTTSPWVLLQVERGAFDFELQTRQLPGYASGGTSAAGGPRSRSAARPSPSAPVTGVDATIVTTADAAPATASAGTEAATAGETGNRLNLLFLLRSGIVREWLRRFGIRPARAHGRTARPRLRRRLLRPGGMAGRGGGERRHAG